MVAGAGCGGESSGDGDGDGRGPIDKADLLGSCAGDGETDHCGGPSDGNCFCDERCVAAGDCCSDVTEVCGIEVRARVEVAGYVTGDLIGNRANAEALWQTRCDSWTAVVVERSGGTLVESACGEAENLSSSSFLFASAPTVTVEVEVAASTAVGAGGGPAEEMSGPLAGNLAEALNGYAAKCEARAAELATLYGDRLVAAACAKPVNASSSSFLHRGPLTLWLRELPAGGRAPLETRISGGLVGNLAEALASWQAACRDFVAGQVARSGLDAVERHACGTPENKSSSSFRFESTAQVVAVSAGVEATSWVPRTAAGALVGNVADAMTSWRQGCDALLDQAAGELGDRYLAGGCGVPQNLSSSSFLFQSPITIATRAPAGPTVTAPFFAGGEVLGNLEPALADWQVACDRARAEVMTAAGANLVSAECGPRENRSSSSFLFASTGQVVFAAELAAGLSLTHTTSELAGVAMPNLVDAMASWRQACTAELAARKAEHGDALIGATCGATTNSGSSSFRFVSQAERWVHPAP